MAKSNKTQKDQKHILKIKYTKSDDHQSYTASGVYGGIELSGYISMNFYRDNLPLPEFADMEVDSQTKKILKTKHPPNDYNVIREIKSSIIVDLENAKRIKNWLNDRIKELENEIKASK